MSGCYKLNVLNRLRCGKAADVEYKRKRKLSSGNGML